MANGAVPEIVLQFRLRQIVKAEKLAKDVLKSVKESTTLTKKERTSKSKEVRNQIQRLRVVKKAELGRIRSFEQDRRAMDRFFQRAGQAREGAEQAATIAGLRGSGSRLAAIGTLFGRQIPIVGIVIAAVEPLISAAIDKLRTEFQKGVDVLSLRLEQQIDQAKEDEPLVAFQRRLAEDPEFARLIDENSLIRARAADRGQSWSGGDADTLAEF